MGTFVSITTLTFSLPAGIDNILDYNRHEQIFQPQNIMQFVLKSSWYLAMCGPAFMITESSWISVV